MTEELYILMCEWLESGEPHQKKHAAYRLSLPDAVGDEIETTELIVTPSMQADPWDAKIRACPHFNPGCCASPAPFCDLYEINPTREQCIECLARSQTENPDA